MPSARADSETADASGVLDRQLAGWVEVCMQAGERPARKLAWRMHVFLAAQ